MYPLILFSNVNLENKMYRVMNVSSSMASSPSNLTAWLKDFSEKNNCKLIAVDGSYYIFEEKISTDGFLYCEFNINQMLNFINKYSDRVILEKVRSETWRLFALSRHFGEYENTGSLSKVVSQAFKPFVEKAKAEQQEMKKVFNGILD